MTVPVLDVRSDSEARPALDRDLALLRERAATWMQLGLDRRIAYAEGLLRGFRRIASGQVEAGLEAKGASFDSPAIAAEEWISGPVINLRTTRLLIQSLRQIWSGGRVEIAARDLRSRPGGRVAVRVFPSGPMDHLLYRGFRGEVWMPPGVEREEILKAPGPAYLGSGGRGRVSLVLGAGNVASIAPLDAVHKLFQEGHVVLFKLNPVNSYLEPFYEDAFGELIADGFVRIQRGGPEIGDYLCRHPAVDEIHITGSAHTHDMIVWGAGDEARRRREQGEPRIDKPITSELGNVSAVIVLPGRWSAADLDFHAENLATQMTHNAGFNCNATKVVVTWQGWPQRDELIGRIESYLAAIPARDAYYPGAERRYDRFLAAYPDAHAFGTRAPERVPPTLAVGVDPEEPGLVAREESFCTFSCETSLPAEDPAAYLGAAVDFCNERLYGTLNVGLIVDPATRRELGASFVEAIARLRYGTIAINHWPALGFALGCLPWGAFPGHTLEDIQSGIGVVHNTFLLEPTERSVVDGPFRVTPKPLWFATHRNAGAAARHLVAIEYDQSPRHLPPLFWHALRG